MTKKLCIKCKKEKPLSEFNKRNDRKSGLDSRCKSCNALRCNNWYKTNQEKRKDYVKTTKIKRKENRLKKLYDITMDQFKQMLNDQDNKCAICGRTFLDNSCVDHDHDTGKVRELLCNNCNTGIGLLGDNPLNAKRAWEYLEFHKRLS